jgi:hypothetical protein
MKRLAYLPLLLTTITACLPADDRPPPGRLELQASPSIATSHGVTTKDLWDLRFDRVLLGIGEPSLGDDCVSYGEANYSRLLNLLAGPGQKLGIVYGTGNCDISFRTASPTADSVLGDGVSEADRSFMGTPDSDAYVQAQAISLQVDGHATQSGITKTFSFSFRQRLRFDHCSAVINGATVTGVSLSENSNEVIDLSIAVERIFLSDVRDNYGTLRFTPFAQSDTNNDGIITLEEIGKTQLYQLNFAGLYSIGDADPNTVKTLEDYVYLLLMPSIPRFRDLGVCSASLRDHGYH